jgi:hypothetical protein
VLVFVANWGFLTKHAGALLCIARDPGVRLRDIATTLNITERRAYTIVTDLTAAGYVLKVKDGRRNRYEVQAQLPLPDTTGRERTVGHLLDLLGSTDARRPRKRATRPAGDAVPRPGSQRVSRKSSTRRVSNAAAAGS